jgi:hypothetical protein
VCLSGEHIENKCPLMALVKRNPCPSLLIPEARIDLSVFGPMTDLSTIDFSSLRFPQKQSHEQFLDFWTTVFAKFFRASSAPEANAAGNAAEAWSLHYHIDSMAIRQRKKSKQALADREGSNAHPHAIDADAELALRAMRAARLGPDARASDISKALRKGCLLPLSDGIVAKLSLLYPIPNANIMTTTFDAPPLACHSANRHSVARAVLSRSPNSHPGKLGITFSILQLFCQLTFKREDPNAPDPRWSLFCELISHIMAGKAAALSPAFHSVVGVYFDKNFEKPGAPVSLRNIGIEESLVRIAAALVFQDVIRDAVMKGFLSCWELGCGVRSGAEIFGRIGAVATDHGMIVAVFDVEKAFNNIQRSDIKDAVDNFNNPLLSAFVAFMFERDPIITFRYAAREAVFTLKQGIVQGNPLSTFLFSLTICWILKPFRERYPLSITPSFVDDLQLIAPISENFPQMLDDFVTLFRCHGLRFDLSDDAKSSVFSILPLPEPISAAILLLGVRTQNIGIAPCKVPFGNPNFIAAHITKQQEKFMLRFNGFKALWPALLKLKPTCKSSRIGVHEGYLNLLRLSLLSMPIYTLRTVNPLFCAPYASMVSSLSLQLIELVFPPRLSLIGRDLPPNAPAFPSMMDISVYIMQLPLSLGGLSLRLPRDTSAIAYTASCGESVPYLLTVAARLGFQFDSSSLPGLVAARSLVTAQLEGYRSRKPNEMIVFERLQGSDPMPLQESLTSLFNHAEIVRIVAALRHCPVYLHAFLARVDKDQTHCSWPFNPAARRNLNLNALTDEDFSRAIQIAILRPVTIPRGCDCGAVIDPAGLHFLSCKLVHFAYLHNCVKDSLAFTIKSFQPLDLAPLSILKEVPVHRFYPGRDMESAEGTVVIADLVASLVGTSQLDCVIADVSSVLARGPSSSLDFHAPLRERSQEKRHKYRKYDIPVTFLLICSTLLPSAAPTFCRVMHCCFVTSLPSTSRL